ncbi:MAG: radical SAM protein, partial [Phycisphaerae bacterium]
MIGISRLISDRGEPSDRLRYRPRRMRDRRPVVVLNTTRRCNLFCAHCYAASTDPQAECSGELSTDELRRLLDDIARFGSPVVLFSGGEPLLREDLFELIAHARAAGLRASISTNGTLIDAGAAQRLADAGAAYVGVSIDGLAETNDAFRASEGAFQQALAGIRHCRDVGLKAGLRLTMTRWNLPDLSGVFDLLVAEAIP